MNVRPRGAAAALVLLTFATPARAEGPAIALLAASPTVQSMTPDEMTALVNSVKPAVSQLRGLPFLRNVPVKMVDKATAQRYFKSRAEKYWPKERALLEQRLLVHLGLLPAGYDMVGGLFDLLEEQVAGYYDPQSDTFFVLAEMPRASAPIIIAHELTHALDDQHYDIDGLLERTKDDDDRQSAVSALVEGSGTLVMSSYLVREIKAGRLTMAALTEMQETDAGRAASLGTAPVFLQRSLLAPYVVGQGFLLRGNLLALATWTAGGGGDIDRAFKDLPQSFEQVLHPEKYWDAAKRDAPARPPVLDQSATLGEGWKLALTGTLGEMGIAVIGGLGGVDMGSPAVGIPSSWTNEIGTGWDGDRYHFYANGERGVTVLSTVWDTEADAREFEAAAAGGARRAWREGLKVVVVAGDAAERHEALARAALAGR